MAKVKDQLMMAGSSLIQVGGMLILGPCETSFDREEKVFLMMGDELASDYNVDFKDTYNDTRWNGWFRYDPRVIIDGCPPTKQNEMSHMEFSRSIGLRVSDWYPRAVNVAEDNNSGIFGGAGPSSGFIVFEVAFEMNEVFVKGGVASGNLGRVLAGRKFNITRADQNLKDEDIPASDDFHYYSKKLTVEIDALHSVYRPEGGSDWDLSTLLGWHPDISGVYPTIAVARVDEFNNIKEILWQSK